MAALAAAVQALYSAHTVTPFQRDCCPHLPVCRVPEPTDQQQPQAVPLLPQAYAAPFSSCPGFPLLDWPTLGVYAPPTFCFAAWSYAACNAKHTNGSAVGVEAQRKEVQVPPARSARCSVRRPLTLGHLLVSALFVCRTAMLNGGQLSSSSCCSQAGLWSSGALWSALLLGGLLASAFWLACSLALQRHRQQHSLAQASGERWGRLRLPVQQASGLWILCCFQL